MSYRLDLTLSPKRFQQGSIEVFLNWANLVDAAGTEPAMVFRRKLGDNRAVAVLRLSELHNFVSNSGYGMGAAVFMGMKLAEAVGCTPGDKFAARDVTDLIVEYAEDLVKMPSEPPAVVSKSAAPQQKAELAIQIDGQTVLETEVAA